MCFSEAVTQRCSVKRCSYKFRKMFFFLKKESLPQMFSSEFCEILQNTSGGCFWLFLFQCEIINNRHAQCLDLFFAKELLLYRTITLTVHEAGIQIIDNNFWQLLSLAGTDSSQANSGKKGSSLLLSIPFLPTHKHSEISLHFYIWDFTPTSNCSTCNNYPRL